MLTRDEQNQIFDRAQALEAMDGPPHGRRPQRYFW